MEATTSLEWKKRPTRVVRFLRGWRAGLGEGPVIVFNAGERAGLDPGIAARLIANGIAVDAAEEQTHVNQ